MRGGDESPTGMHHLSFKPSRQLSACLTAGHIVAAACVLSVTLPLWLRGMLLIALLLSLLHATAYQAWRAWPWSIVALQFEREGGVIVQYRNGAVREARVLSSSFVAPYLTIILLKPKRAWFSRSVVLMPDMLTPALFRSVRVWLKWRLGQGVAPQVGAEWSGLT